MAQIKDIELLRETLKNVIKYYTDIPEYQLDEFAACFSYKSFKKNEVIIPPDSKHHNFYFILKGLIRIYYLAEGKEIISDFKEPNSFFINGYTLFTGLPNIDYHTALETTECLVADYNAIENLSAKYHPIEHLGRKMVESYYASYLITNYNKLFLSADERFDIFMKERRNLMNRVLLKHVASHLGIKPETLSRLRAKQQTIKY